MRLFITIFLSGVILSLSATNYFVEGTKWYVSNRSSADYTVGDFNGFLYEITLPLKKSEVEELTLVEHEVVNGSIAGESGVIAYIRTEGEEVYFRYPGDLNKDNWWLMYDFDISLEETVKIYSAEKSNNPEKDPLSVDLYCYDISLLDNHNIEVIKVIDDERMDQLAPDYVYPERLDFNSGKWIKGIGSTEGPITNCRYGLVGGYKSKLLRAENSEGEIMYDAEWLPSVVRNIEDSHSTSAKYHLDGTPFEEGDKGLYIEDKKVHITPSAY